MHPRGQVYTLFRDSVFGQFVYIFSGKRWLRPRFCCDSYKVFSDWYIVSEKPEKFDVSVTDSGSDASFEKHSHTHPSNSSKDDLASVSVNDVKESFLITWDSQDDPENPKNWPAFKKAIVSSLIGLMTLTVYMAGTLHTPANDQIMQEFNASETQISLGISLFIWGYALSSLWVSPMTEIPLFGGRNWIYVSHMFLFFVLQIPTALVNSVVPWLVLRFFAGIFAAPPVAYAAASFRDIYDAPAVVYALMVWGGFFTCAPYIAPLIGSALTFSNGWRWAFIFNTIMSGTTFLLVFLFLPETSAQALLMRKARHLRRRLNNPHLLSRGDILEETQSCRQIIVQMFYSPIKIFCKDFVVLVTGMHMALFYGIFYVYFECFPLVYNDTYHFTSVEQGASYLALLTGSVIALTSYAFYVHKYVITPFKQNDPADPVIVFGAVAIFASFMCPIGFFVFGWTSSPKVHWIASMIGNVVVEIGLLLLYQAYFSLLAYLYEQNVAAVFSALSLSRGAIGGIFPIIGKQMFTQTSISNFPVGWGCSILSFVSLILCVMPIYLRLFGHELKAKLMHTNLA